MNNFLSVQGITKVFDGKKYLNNISLNINKNDFLVIAGCNGSGKTLLMKHLNGLFPIKKGTIFFNNKDCYKKEQLMRRKIGLIFQNPDNQIVGLTVKDDVAFGPTNIGIKKESIDKIVNSSLKSMSLEHLKERNPHTLSGGEKKRVTIAGVLAMSPEILVFDEPFIGLDYPGVVSVLEALLELKKQGSTIVLISHDLEKVLSYANRLIIMSDGEIKADGLPEELINNVEKWGIRRPVQKNVSEMTWLH